MYGEAAVDPVKRQVARILRLDIDGRDWPAVGKRDPVVAKLQQMFPGFRPVNWSNAHEAAAWSLISTRIAMRQAQGVKDRMSRELGHEVDVHAIASGYFRIPRGSSSSKLSRGCLAARSNI